MSKFDDKTMAVLMRMQSPETVAALTQMDASKMFAGKIADLAMENVFGKLWTRDGLSVKERSFITLGILIALRAEDEMELHFPAAIRNGATVAEIEELLYQSTGYAGFPAAHSARKVAERSLRNAGMIE